MCCSYNLLVFASPSAYSVLHKFITSSAESMLKIEILLNHDKRIYFAEEAIEMAILTKKIKS